MLTQHHPLPRETFEILLKHAIMPTFDLLINYNDEELFLSNAKLRHIKTCGRCLDCACIKEKPLIQL